MDVRPGIACWPFSLTAEKWTEESRLPFEFGLQVTEVTCKEVLSRSNLHLSPSSQFLLLSSSWGRQDLCASPVPKLFLDRWLVSIAVSLILIGTGSVYAQDSSDADALSLEELLNAKVYSASKYEQKVAEAPSSISVITADEIRKYGYRTIEEALRSVNGILC